jgi:hypothetical protein
MENREIRPGAIQVGLNSPSDREFVADTAESMRTSGWRGRRLLVEAVPSPSPSGVEYWAWTGSHRIEAAKQARLDTVPCRVITAEEAMQAFTSVGFPPYREGHWSSWQQAIAGSPGGSRNFLNVAWAALVKAGLTEAADLFREDMTATDGHRLSA